MSQNSHDKDQLVFDIDFASNATEQIMCNLKWNKTIKQLTLSVCALNQSVQSKLTLCDRNELDNEI